MGLRVDVGVFAHNEAAGIAAMLTGLMAQDVHRAEGVSVRVVVLCNGCTDDTADRARGVAGVEVADLPLGGKSRTWTRFVHDLSRPDADMLIFCDADIELPVQDALLRLVRGLAARHGLRVLSSQPVKDIIHRPHGLTRQDRLIARATGGLDNWKQAICGQLYAMPAAVARQFHLPVGLPVEDGFLRAMVLTDRLTQPEDLGRIDGADGVFHVYDSERKIGALIRHQVRIVIGSAVNFACFRALERTPPADRAAVLSRAAGDEAWLPGVIRTAYPVWPHGYVPLHFLTKRLARAGADWRRPKRWPVLAVGFGFDLVVYVLAQIRMARGAGAGFW